MAAKNYKVLHGKYSRRVKNPDGSVVEYVFKAGDTIDTDKFPISEASAQNLGDQLAAVDKPAAPVKMPAPRVIAPANIGQASKPAGQQAQQPAGQQK